MNYERVKLVEECYMTLCGHKFYQTCRWRKYETSSMKYKWTRSMKGKRQVIGKLGQYAMFSIVDTRKIL